MYYRITAHNPQENLTGIFDSNGMFEKLWQFSSYLMGRGFKIIEVSDEDKFLDGNFDRAEPEPDKFFIRAYAEGQPEKTTTEIDGKVYPAIKVGDMIYVPDRTITGGRV